MDFHIFALKMNIQILSHIKTEEYKIQLIQKKQKVEEEIIRRARAE